MRARARDIQAFGTPNAGARRRSLAAAAIAMGLLASASLAQTGTYRGVTPGEYNRGVNRMPEAMEGIDVFENRGGYVPLDALVIDSDGRRATLGEYFDGKRPVVLNLVYFECPMLCGLTLADATRAVRESRWEIGKDYRVLTISFDHTNTIAQAAGKKAEYAGAVRREGVNDGWSFFVTTEKDARAIADSVGFTYKRLPNGEFSHPSVQIVLTPEGQISTYLYGLYNKEGASFNRTQLELSLQTASGGQLGGIFAKLAMFCYVHTEDGYALSAYRVMQVAGAGTVVLLSGFVGVMFLWERRKRDARARSEAIVTTAHA
ncbi:MAG: SCO family protein [Phycisphaeraceae bacterium]|nr:SCO family protein [Phycisphaeraceae bacterium]